MRPGSRGRQWWRGSAGRRRVGRGCQGRRGRRRAGTRPWASVARRRRGPARPTACARGPKGDLGLGEGRWTRTGKRGPSAGRSRRAWAAPLTARPLRGRPWRAATAAIAARLVRIGGAVSSAAAIARARPGGRAARHDVDGEGGHAPRQRIAVEVAAAPPPPPPVPAHGSSFSRPATTSGARSARPRRAWAASPSASSERRVAAVGGTGPHPGLLGDDDGAAGARQRRARQRRRPRPASSCNRGPPGPPGQILEHSRAPEGLALPTCRASRAARSRARRGAAGRASSGAPASTVRPLRRTAGAVGAGRARGHLVVGDGEWRQEHHRRGLPPVARRSATALLPERRGPRTRARVTGPPPRRGRARPPAATRCTATAAPRGGRRRWSAPAHPRGARGGLDAVRVGRGAARAGRRSAPAKAASARPALGEGWRCPSRSHTRSTPAAPARALRGPAGRRGPHPGQRGGRHGRGRR